MEKQFRPEGWAHRLGRKAGRGWAGYLRRERQVAGWLIARGLPAGGATALLWIVKLLVLGVLVYVVFWLALLLVFLAVITWAASKADWEVPQPEWRNGPAGFGLYTHDGHRIDPHVSDDD